MTTTSGERIKAPTHCPACGTALRRDCSKLWCPNRNGCRPQIVGRLHHYCATLDIEAGEHLIGMIVDYGWASEPSDLVKLHDHAGELAHVRRDHDSLTSIGRGRVQRLLADIDRARSEPLAKQIVAACIAHVGPVASEKIARQWPSLGELARADVTDLVRRTRINLEQAKAVLAWASANRTS